MSLATWGGKRFVIIVVVIIDEENKKTHCRLMSVYFCPHLMFNSGFLIEFVCLKSDLINSYDK